MIAMLIVLLVSIGFAGLTTYLTDAPFWYLLSYLIAVSAAVFVYQYMQYRHLYKNIAEIYRALLRS